MRFALVRELSSRITECQLTHMDREPIDVDKARAQHAAYTELLKQLGCQVITIPTDDNYPDCVFIEDPASVVNGVAVIARSGTESRRGESGAVEDVLAEYRRIQRIVAPGTLDGGDVIVSGKTVYIGRSTRSNDDGIVQFTAHVAPEGYAVKAVMVTGCLHLKTAATLVSDELMLCNREWADCEAFENVELLDVDPAEPFAGNVLRIGDDIIIPEQHPRTMELLQKRGLNVHPVPQDEFAKAEGGVTCCSIIFEADWKPRLAD